MRKVFVNPNERAVFIPRLDNPHEKFYVYPTNFGYISPPQGVTQIEVNNTTLKAYQHCLSSGMLVIIDLDVTNVADAKPLRPLPEHANAINIPTRSHVAFEPTTDVNATGSVVSSGSVINEDKEPAPVLELAPAPTAHATPIVDPVNLGQDDAVEDLDDEATDSIPDAEKAPRRKLVRRTSK